VLPSHPLRAIPSLPICIVAFPGQIATDTCPPAQICSPWSLSGFLSRTSLFYPIPGPHGEPLLVYSGPAPFSTGRPLPVVGPARSLVMMADHFLILFPPNLWLPPRVVLPGALRGIVYFRFMYRGAVGRSLSPPGSEFLPFSLLCLARHFPFPCVSPPLMRFPESQFPIFFFCLLSNAEPVRFFSYFPLEFAIQPGRCRPSQFHDRCLSVSVFVCYHPCVSASWRFFLIESCAGRDGTPSFSLLFSKASVPHPDGHILSVTFFPLGPLSPLTPYSPTYQFLRPLRLDQRPVLIFQSLTLVGVLQHALWFFPSHNFFTPLGWTTPLRLFPTVL